MKSTTAARASMTSATATAIAKLRGAGSQRHPSSKLRALKLLKAVLPTPCISALKLLWAKYSFRTFRPRTVCHKYGSHTLQMRIVDYDGAEWYDKDLDAFPEFPLLRKHKLRPGALVFNAGGNQCLQGMMLAREVAPSGQVYALEPNKYNVDAARRNIELNLITNCSVLQAAVSSKSGRLRVNQSMNGQVSSSRADIGSVLVEAVSIDDLSARVGLPDVLYIDVEGYECEVLAGARRTMTTKTPDCYVEVHVGIGLERFGGSPNKLLSFFPRNRYMLFWCDQANTTFSEVTSAESLPRNRFHLLALAASTHSRGERPGAAG
jgi:FkbM family methyltransferase